MWLSVCARGGAGVCGCGAEGQCGPRLLVHGPAPLQQKPTEEEKGDKESISRY